MADIGYIKLAFGGTPDAIKKAAEQAFTYLLGNLSLTQSDRGKAGNFLLYYQSGTTSSNANQEFSVAHGMESTPSIVIPVLPLNEVGAQLVPLTVSRAADTKRVYLKSSSTSAAFTVLVG